MLELRDEEFSGLFAETEEGQTVNRSDHAFVVDCQVDTDLELLFPDEYIRNVAERVRLYRELDSIETEDSLVEFERQLVDRFGALPEQTRELLNVVRLRWIAKNLGFEKIIIKNGKMVINFVSNQMSPYYQSPVFEKIIRFVQQNPRTFHMKEAKDKLTMTSDIVNSIGDAMKLFARISGFNPS